MSRQIDITKPLSAEDLEYLDSRARHDLIEQNRRLLAETAQDEAPERINDGNTGDVDPFKADDGSDLLAGTHPHETPVNPIQTIESQGISDLGDEDKDPEDAYPENTEPSVQAGDGIESPVAAEQEDAEDGEDLSSEDDDYADFTNEELREELGSRNLSKSGNKAEMIARLRENDSEDDEE